MSEDEEKTKKKKKEEKPKDKEEKEEKLVEPKADPEDPAPKQGMSHKEV